MATNAGDGLVCAFQLKACRAVIEGAQGFPLHCIVASLAGLARVMRVHMTGRAVLDAVVILTGRYRYSTLQRLVTIRADHCQMRPREDKFRLLMFR